MAKTKYLIERDIETPTLDIDEIMLIESLAAYQKTLTLIAKKGYTVPNTREIIDKVNDILILSNAYMNKINAPKEAIEESFERRLRKLIKE